MNRIILLPEEIADDGVCTLSDQRAVHLCQFLHAAPGRRVKVGVLNGPIGWAEVLAVADDGAVSLCVDCREAALEPWFDLLIALPRPRAIKRLWPQMATMGVRTIYLTAAEKVEKSYFSSHALRPEAYRPLLIDGLMQAGTTRLPEVVMIPKFHQIGGVIPQGGARFLAHPRVAKPDFSGITPGVLPLIAVGPDGGWSDRECEHFFALGFQPFSLGERPLRTDTAAIALVATLQFALGEMGGR